FRLLQRPDDVGVQIALRVRRQVASWQGPRGGEYRRAPRLRALMQPEGCGPSETTWASSRRSRRVFRRRGWAIRPDCEPRAYPTRHRRRKSASPYRRQLRQGPARGREKVPLNKTPSEDTE